MQGEQVLLCSQEQHQPATKGTDIQPTDNSGNNTRTGEEEEHCGCLVRPHHDVHVQPVGPVVQDVSARCR